MVETRIAPRHRVALAGKITFSRTGAVDCVVRNLSLTGASLEVTSQIGIPDQFTLIVKSDGLELPCHVVRRAVFRIGVVFE
jgi:hypothetical protein